DFDRKLSYQALVSEIEAGRIGRTETLFCSAKSVVTLLEQASAYEEIVARDPNRPFGRKLIATCPKCRPTRYRLASHSVRLTRAGRIDDPKPIVPVTGHEFAHSTRALLHRHSAEFLFNVAGVANYVLSLVRRLAGYSRMSPEQKC